MTTFHRGHPLTIARHEALSSPLSAEERHLPIDTRWLRSRGGLFVQAAQRSFELTFDLVRYAKRTGLPFHPHYVAQVYRGEPEKRLEVPLMAVNLAQVQTREAADKVLAHESMHLRVPSYGHKREAFACAQEILNAVGSMEL